MSLLRNSLLSRASMAITSAIVALVVFMLPTTSFPMIASLFGKTLVAPPSVLFLFMLVVGWLPVYLLKSGVFPGEMIPWLVFGGAVLLSSVLSFFLPMPAYKNHTIASAETEALLTFGIALTCYMVFSTWIRQRMQLRWVLMWINIGGLVLLAWSMAQLYIILINKGAYPGFMVKVQAFISLRSLQDPIYYTRLAGFAYEPSWLAHQLNILYLPFWLAATITGYSAHTKRLKISLENILLAGGVIVLMFTYSRVGLLAFFLVLAYGVYRLSRYGIRLLLRSLRYRKQSIRVLVEVLSVPLVFTLYALLILGLLSLLSRVDIRIAKMLEFRNISADLMNFAFRTDFSERVMYWANGWLVFARYPLFGVGLGNAGFFFSEHLHILGYRSNEILQVLNDAVYLPNIKSLWVRILAETGLVGFSFFLAGYHLLWRVGHNLAEHSGPLFRAVGWMGIFVLIAFLAEGFSVDSFAMPYFWISMGVLTAASAIVRKSTSGQDIAGSG